MVVVADSSPLIALIGIERVDLLPVLCGEILVPPEVIDELLADNRSQIVRLFAQSLPTWIRIRSDTTVESISNLDLGERAAISLAIQIKADLLLLDDWRARKVALSRHLPIMGVVGLLETAATRGLIDLASAFDRLSKSDFWISTDLLNERLSLYYRQPQPPQ